MTSSVSIRLRKKEGHVYYGGVEVEEKSLQERGVFGESRKNDEVVLIGDREKGSFLLPHAKGMEEWFEEFAEAT
jgi:hypothetical protein